MEKYHNYFKVKTSRMYSHANRLPWIPAQPFVSPFWLVEAWLLQNENVHTVWVIYKHLAEGCKMTCNNQHHKMTCNNQHHKVTCKIQNHSFMWGLSNLWPRINFDIVWLNGNILVRLLLFCQLPFRLLQFRLLLFPLLIIFTSICFYL